MLRLSYTKIILVVALTALAVPVATHAFSLSEIIFSIVGVLLGTAAGLLNAAIDIFVLNMGAQINDSSIGVGINTVWLLVRDFVNLTFVFGLMYVGIMTILGEGGANAKRLIASIVISALLVNFSLFFSKFIIDIANVASVEIYNGMGLQVKGRSVADVVMIRSGLMDLATNSYNPGNAPDLFSDEWLGYVVTGSIFILVATFVFAAAGILLIIRFAVLVILMAISPIAFVSRGLPIVGGWSSAWWGAFINQALFAPALLFMFFITLKITDGISNQTNAFSQIANPQNLRNGYVSMIYFGLLIVGLIASIIIAKKMGAYGADTALKWGKNMRKSAVSWAGRNSLGRLGRAAGKEYARLDNAYANSSFGRSRLGKFTRAVTYGTMDRTIREGLHAVEAGKYGGSRNLASDEKYEKEVKATRSRITREHAQKEAIAKILAGSPTADDIKTLHDMTISELEHLGMKNIKPIARYLSNKQADQIKDSKEGFTNTEKAELKADREKAQKDAFDNGKNAAAFFKGMKGADMAKLPKDILKHDATIPFLDGTALRKIQDDEVLSRESGGEAEILANKIRNHPQAQAKAIKYLDSSRGQEFYGVAPNAGAQTQSPHTPPSAPPSGNAAPPQNNWMNTPNPNAKSWKNKRGTP